MSKDNSPSRQRRGSSLDGALATPDRGGNSSALTLLLDTSPCRHRPRRQEQTGLDHHNCSGPQAGTSAVVDVAATDRTPRSRRSHNHPFDEDIERLQSRTMTSTIGGISSSPTGRSSSSQATRRHQEGRSVLIPHPNNESAKQRRQWLKDEDSATSLRSPRVSEKRERQQQKSSRGESDKHSTELSTSMRHHSDENVSSRVSPGTGVRRIHRGHGEATAAARLLDDRRCGGDESRLSSGIHLPKEATRERSRSRSSVSSSPLSERRRPFSPSSSIKTPLVASPERIENRHRGNRIDSTSRKSRDPITAEREKLEIEKGDVMVGRVTRDRHYDRGHGEAYHNRRPEEKDRGRVVEGRGRTLHRRHDDESPRSLRSTDTRNSSTGSIRRYRSSLSPDGEGLENKTRAIRHSRSDDREGSTKVSKSRQSSREHLSMVGSSKGAISSDIEGGKSVRRYIRDDRSSTPPSRSRSRSPDYVDAVEKSHVRSTASTRGRTSRANRGDDERYWSTRGKYASSPCSSRGGTGRSSGARGSPDSRRQDHLDGHRIDVHYSSSHRHRHRTGEETDNSIIGMARTTPSRERQKNACDGEEGVRIPDGRCRTGGHDYDDSRSKSVAIRSSSSHGNHRGIRRQLEDRSAGRKEEDRRRSRHSHAIEERERHASSRRHTSRTHSSDSPERRSRHHDRSSKDEYSRYSGERHRVRRPPSLIKFDREDLLSMCQGGTTDAARGEDGEGGHHRLHRREKDHDGHRSMR